MLVKLKNLMNDCSGWVQGSVSILSLLFMLAAIAAFFFRVGKIEKGYSESISTLQKSYTMIQADVESNKQIIIDEQDRIKENRIAMKLTLKQLALISEKLNIPVTYDANDLYEAK